MKKEGMTQLTEEEVEAIMKEVEEEKESAQPTRAAAAGQ
mgnify:FL=1